MRRRINYVFVFVLLGGCAFGTYWVAEESANTEALRTAKGNLMAAYKLVMLTETEKGEWIIAPGDGPLVVEGTKIHIRGNPMIRRWPPPAGGRIVVQTSDGKFTDQPPVPTIAAYSDAPVRNGKRFVMLLGMERSGYGFDFLSDDEVSWYFQVRRDDLTGPQRERLRTLTGVEAERDLHP
jgi:hypothetical protein